MTRGFTRRQGLLGASALGALAMAGTPASAAGAQGRKAARGAARRRQQLRPQSFLAVNFPLFKNLYDSLIEYDAKVRRSRASPRPGRSRRTTPAWSMTLRSDVKFHSGGAFDANAVAATLKKGADPRRQERLSDDVGREGMDRHRPARDDDQLQHAGADRQITDCCSSSR